MFILYFDNKYFRWGEQLIESIQLHEPDEGIYVYGINLANEQTFKLFRRYRNITKLQKFDVEEKEPRVHMIAHKARFILNVMERFPLEEFYFMLDADMLLVNDLDSIKHEMFLIPGGYDFAGIEANPDKICGGFYIIRRTKQAIAFLKEWDEFLGTGDYYWDKDQPSMARILKRHRANGLKFLPVSRLYLDHLSREEAFVWSAHKSEFGNKDQRYELYQKTMNDRVSGKLLCQSI